jgi:hypothetical protein
VDDRILLVCIRPVVDGNSSGRLARDGDFVGITAEVLDVVADPFDSCSLIAETEVLRLARGSRKAKDVEPIVDCDDDDVLCVGKVFARVERAVCVSNGEPCSLLSDLTTLTPRRIEGGLCCSLPP